ncbi:hypothetical protein [Bacillus swezeyi]|uniref:Uncharacterized protein n=1 Tax=Bacillus swezeyi TaxID=1925020 RepID=A0A5M8RIU3_9BACI|nr:hypothetical protein [Bacillus swezeyi]KAA6446983.1 hypothetical protein DX927_23345 [Bacillus swezeyi]KAA6471551.1 hypothetical protein DX928_23585 [Bacillus swezeyi]
MEEHKNHITTVTKWDEYAKQNDLPSAAQLIHAFVSWSNLKTELGLSKSSNKGYPFTKEELIQIAIDHSEHFTTIRKWNEYARDHQLPRHMSYVNAFGGWNEAKKEMELKITEDKKAPTYTKEQLRRILEENQRYFINQSTWNKHAKNNKLPYYLTIRKHFSYDEIVKITNTKKNKGHTQKDLLEILIDHREFFFKSSLKKWDKYAREKYLPSSTTIYRAFKGWKNAKIELTRFIKESTN